MFEEGSTVLMKNLTPAMDVDDASDLLTNTTAQDTSWECTENNTYGKEFYEKAVFTTGLILYPTFCIPGLIANLITVMVMSRKAMRSSTNLYLAALAVSDSIKLLSDLVYPTILIVIRVDQTGGELLFAHIYPYGHFFLNFSVCISSWLVVSVASERYIMICHPTKAKSVCTMRRSKIVTVAVYVSMTILAFPTLFRYQTVYEFDNCTNQYRWNVAMTNLWKEGRMFPKVYNWCQNLLRSITPLIILIVLNLYIINAVRRTRNSKRIVSRYKITLMLIAVTLLFLVTCTPDAIMSTVLGFGYVESANYVVKGVREFTDCLLTLNSAANFVIYCAMNKDFKHECLQMCCKRLAARCCKPKNYSFTSGIYQAEVETFKPEETECANFGDTTNILSTEDSL